MSIPSLTIGIEEEYQIIDPSTRELRSYARRFLERGEVLLPDQIHPEFMQSQVEAGTRICHNIQEARSEVTRMRRSILELAEREGLWVAAAGTHPFSSWARQEVSPFDPYPGLAHILQDVGRRLLIFGMHIHIGIEDRELLIEVMNELRYFLPYLLALSTSSPFWHGRDTGLKSYRSILFESLPHTGIPRRFDSHTDYRRALDILLTTGSIAEPTHVWWDVRPSEKFPTLEVRIPDMCTRVEETLCLAALVQAIVAKLVHLRQTKRLHPAHLQYMIEENKWRAVRYGVTGKLINLNEMKEREFPQLVEDLLAWISDAANELGSRPEINYAHTILREGTSADRQLSVFHHTRDFRAVVDHVVEETQRGVK